MDDLFALATPALPLRAYQQEALDAVVAGFAAHRTQLVVIPTGGGKTILFAHIAKHFAQRGMKTLVLAHREELLLQAKDKIQRATGLWCEVEKAEREATFGASVVIGSVQTLCRKKRRETWPADHFGLIVVDEAHHVLAKSYLDVLEYFDARVLGVTATPDRGDKKNLGKFFENLAFECSLVRLIKEQFLVPIKVKTLPVRMDLTKAKTVAGDYSADDVAREIEPWLERVAAAMAGEAWDRKIIVFLPLVRTSQRMAQALASEGFEARSVSGYDVDREETLRWFAKAGPGSVLCNAMLLTEGFDQPDVDCVVVLRPTQVRALYAQMVGRGTRLSPETGKTELLLLDFLWQAGKVSLVSPASLVCSDPEDVRDIQEQVEDVPKTGGPSKEVDLVEASEAVEQQRFEKVKAKLRENRSKTALMRDALELCLSIGAADLMDYEPTTARDARAPTEGQLRALDGAGFSGESITCFGHASFILDRLAARRADGLATPKQVRMLRGLGHPQPETVSKDEATLIIGRFMSARRGAA